MKGLRRGLVTNGQGSGQGGVGAGEAWGGGRGGKEKVGWAAKRRLPPNWICLSGLSGGLVGAEGSGGGGVRGRGVGNVKDPRLLPSIQNAKWGKAQDDAGIARCFRWHSR